MVADAGANDATGQAEVVDASPPAELPDAAVDSGRAPEAPGGMLLVPGGTFTMGLDGKGQEDEHPAHQVTVAAFFLDRTEVTNEAYASCVKAGGCKEKDVHVVSKAHGGPDAAFDHPRQPVNGVSWYDATRFCAWRGDARLPREAEWERAARDGDGRMYPWGTERPDAAKAVFARQFGHDTTDDVGSHPDGRGPYGHDDLAGNVWEWQQDEYDPIAYRRPGASTGTPGTCEEILATLNHLRASGEQGFTGSNPIPSTCEHVLRGGAFNYDGFGLRSSNRVHHPGGFRLAMSGFRCAKDAK
jgi:formylglycine-generating enzyme required for sulfatase activity